jgi:hypothetical protein
VNGISNNQLAVALIAAALAAVTTLVFFVLESQRARRERREEYFLDSAGDLADRIWGTVVALRAHGEPSVGWEDVRRTALVLRAGLLGQTPRYRLARVQAASEAVTVWLGSFIGFRASTLGRDLANRNLLAMVAEHHRDAAEQASTDPRRAPDTGPEIAFTAADLDAALLDLYHESLDKLEELVLGLLEELARYSPAGSALEVSQPSGSWPDYSTALDSATTRRLSRENTG